MPSFEYKGKNKKGEIIEGVMIASNKDSALSKLKTKRLSDISIELSHKKGNSVEQFFYNLQRKKPSLEDLIMFSRQMYSLIRSGVPIIRAITVVGESIHNDELKLALKDITFSLESGQALGQAMSHYKDIFPTLMIALVNVGENTGSLDEVFHQIAIHLEREGETKKRIKTATRYPMVVFIAIFIAVGVINVVVVPAFSSFFNKFDAELPLPTQILITTSYITVNYWYLILLGIAGVVVSWLSYLKTTKGRLMWDKHKLQLPLIGGILQRSLLARFARAFALSVRTGVPLLEGIQMIAKTADNAHVGQNISLMRESIERGDSLSRSAKETKMFTPLVLQMLAIGEETGEID